MAAAKLGAAQLSMSEIKFQLSLPYVCSRRINHFYFTFEKPIKPVKGFWITFVFKPAHNFTFVTILVH